MTERTTPSAGGSRPRDPASPRPLSCEELASPAVPADAMRALACAFGEIAVRAGAPILDHYARQAAGRAKADGSPVTDADLAAEAEILPRLAALLPDVPILSEEQASAGVVPRCGATFLLVDPLDGTREFLGRNGEFTVNIALVAGGRPVVGAVYQPAGARLWVGGGGLAQTMAAEPGGGLPPPSERDAIQARPVPERGMVALVSRSHMDVETEAYLGKLACSQRLAAGSALKFCLIAEGRGDVYPRFGPTMEWDTAAGHAVLAAAGGSVTTPDGAVLRYGKAEEQFRNGPFVAWGRRAGPT